eukprot:IDg5293t1
MSADSDHDSPVELDVDIEKLQVDDLAEDDETIEDFGDDNDD